MADILGNSSTDATIGIGETVTGDLEVTGDHDWFRVELTQYQQYTILLTGLTLADPYLRIRDSAGNIIFENDDISSGVVRDSRISFMAPYGGVFYVDVGAYAEGYTGTYQLTVQPYSPPPVFTVDQVADFLANGYWAGDRHPFNVSQGGSITVNITALTPDGQALALTALDLWSDVIGVSFVPVATGGQIVFDDNQDGAFAENVWADGFSTASHVNVSASVLTQYGTGFGSYSLQVYIHEIGHALGLGHGGYYNETADYFSEAEYANDGWSMTVMSYFDQWESTYFRQLQFSIGNVSTPMMGDIAAMQLLYGLSTSTRAGDTIYGFNSNAGRDLFDAGLYPHLTYTIFDTGGIDTLDYSGFDYLGSQLIDLTPGSFSSVGGRTGNVAIAAGTIIENAIGGIYYDTFIPNAANNRLDGGDGEDTVSYANATSGVTVSLLLDTPQDVGGGGGTDTLLNIENLIGSSFDDVLTGASPYGDIRAGDGNDVLIAGGGLGNALYGEAGDDVFIGGSGRYFMVGGEGFDTVDFSGSASGIYVDAFGGTGSILESIERTIGSGFDDRIYGGNHDEEIFGGAGDDFISPGAGRDVITGGEGADTFLDVQADLNRVTITDFAVGDRIVFADADLATFTYSLSGSTLTFAGTGVLTLSGGVIGTLVASAAPEGGVQLTLQPPPSGPPRAALTVTESGQDYVIGGNLLVYGTASGGEVIEVSHGDVQFDASFNLGGDTVVLPGSAGTYTATLSGSFVTITGGDVTVAIPVGTAGVSVQFADSTRTLRFDSSAGQVLLGTQAITVDTAVSASGPPLNDPIEIGPDSLGRLVLAEAGQDVTIGGGVRVSGTTAPGEVIEILHGTVILDASFNVGGDTVVLPGNSASYVATLSGSFATIAGGDVSVSIPVGIGGLVVDFADADQILRFDPATGQVMLGDQPVSPAAAPAAQGLAMSDDGSAKDFAEPLLPIERAGLDVPALELASLYFG